MKAAVVPLLQAAEPLIKMRFHMIDFESMVHG
jgi:hypothetical protein